MGGALLKGWLGAKRFPVHVVEPQPSVALRRMAEAKKILLAEKFPVKHGCRYAAVVIALKPQVLKKETALLAALGGTDALVVSIAAGVSTRFLASGLGARTRVVRAMPNTPGSIGRGITVLCAGSRLSKADRALAEGLMSALGETLWLSDEKLMDAVTAVSGSGPAYVFLLAEALAQAGRAEGFDAATAEKLARATVSGAGALLDTDRRPAAELRREVTSAGGTTEAALEILMGNNGLPRLMRRAVAAARKRGKALGA